MRSIRNLAVVFFFGINNGYAQGLAFSVGDTATYSSFYEVFVQLSEMKLPTYIKSTFKFGLHSTNPKIYFFHCKEYRNSASDNGYDYDQQLNNILLEEPILFSTNEKGSVVIEGDTLGYKAAYIRKYRGVLHKFNDSESSSSWLDEWSLSDILTIKHPELVIIGKVIATNLSKSAFEINDKEVFNDMLVNYADTIKLSRKTSLTSYKTKRGITKTMFQRAVSESELKAYISEKYPISWKMLREGHPEIDTKPFEEKLKTFQPLYREIIGVETSHNRKKLYRIDYQNDEAVLLMGGTNIQCVILRQ